MKSSLKEFVEFFARGLEIEMAGLLVLEHVVGLDFLLGVEGGLQMH